MKIDEFLERVGSEPERTVVRTVWETPPEVAAQIKKGGGMLLTSFLAAQRRPTQRKMTFRHVLGPPASAVDVDGWRSATGARPLPADFRTLLKRINGVHLWANAETGRSYEGLAPLAEWELAQKKLYGAGAPPAIDDRYVAISYHQDGAACVVLDLETGALFLMEPGGPNETAPFGHSVEDLLEWLWEHRLPPAA